MHIEDVSRDGKLLVYSVQEGGADDTSLHVLNVVTGKTLEDELPTARYISVVVCARRRELLLRAQRQSRARCSISTFSERVVARDTLIFGHEFRDEPLTGSDLFDAFVTDDGHYLVVEIDRGVPAKREDIVYRDLTKPNSPFEVLVWGLDSRFSDHLCQRRMVCEDRLPCAQRMHHEGRSRSDARSMDSDCARGAERDR